MQNYLIKNISIVNEGLIQQGDLLIKNGRIEKILPQITSAKAGVAGGVTSFMEMPNTIPPAFTDKLLEDKYKIASQTSLANYSFYMGTSNDNADEVLKTNERKNDVCGIKIFMGSSTGNLLVDNPSTLNRIFSES